MALDLCNHILSIYLCANVHVAHMVWLGISACARQNSAEGTLEPASLVTCMETYIYAHERCQSGYISHCMSVYVCMCKYTCGICINMCAEQCSINIVLVLSRSCPMLCISVHAPAFVLFSCLRFNAGWCSNVDLLACCLKVSCTHLFQISCSNKEVDYFVPRWFPALIRTSAYTFIRECGPFGQLRTAHRCDSTATGPSTRFS